MVHQSLLFYIQTSNQLNGNEIVALLAKFFLNSVLISELIYYHNETESKRSTRSSGQPAKVTKIPSDEKMSSDEEVYQPNSADESMDVTTDKESSLDEHST